MARTTTAAKQALRERVWDRLEAERVARFPFPPHGRIPNFAGAEEAAQRALASPLLRGARRIKVNPDAPQRPLRLEALRAGIEVYVPTPRLRGGFRLLDPAEIAQGDLRAAASLSRGARFAREVPLQALPRLDAVVVGSVAVTRRGARCGKGEGYADLEYGILRSLGQPPLPVLTTVHPLQVVTGLRRQPFDLPLASIVTPDREWPVRRPAKDPGGIDWSRLDADDLAAMPVLAELRARLRGEER